MLNKNLVLSKLLILVSLVAIAVTLTGCSKSDDRVSIHDCFTVNPLFLPETPLASTNELDDSDSQSSNDDDDSAALN